MKKLSRRTPEVKPAQDVNDQALADLARSGLTAKDAKRMQLETIDGDQIRKLTRSKRKNEGIIAGCGYVIPYFTVDGQKIDGFARIRLFPQPGTELDIRYWQPPKSSPRVYFPPLRPWSEIIRNPEIPIIVVEGEEKAYRGCLETGLNVVSLGGVWSFQSKRLGLALLRDLEAIDWRDRPSYIAYDSDREENEQVMLAEARFADELSRRSARVSIIELTSAADRSRRGLDDLLEQEGRAALDKLIENALRYASSFDELNRSFMVIESLAKILALGSGRIYGYGDFKNVIGAKYAKHVLTPSGPKDIDQVKPWLASKNHNEAADMVFEPAQSFPIYIGEDGNRYYNRFKGFGVEPQDGDVTPWLKLVKYVFSGQPASDFAWFLNWLAYKVQNPAGKLMTAVLLIGEPGIGKSLIGELYGAGFGPNYSEIDNDTLKSPYTFDWLGDRLFILANEISPPDRRGDADKIKNLITQTTNTINDKYGAKFRQRNYATYLLTSNHPDPLMIRPKERRFQIFASKATEPAPEPLVAEVLRWRDKQNGVAKLLGFMRGYNISSSFNPTAPAHETEGKAMVVEASKTYFDNFAEEVMADPAKRLGTDIEIWDSRALLSLLDAGANYASAYKALAIALHNAGAWYTRPINTKTGTKHLWVLKNIERWKKEPNVMLAREYERHMLGQTAPSGASKFSQPKDGKVIKAKFRK